MHRQLLLVLFALLCLNLTVYLYLSSPLQTILGATVVAPSTAVSASVDYCPYILITPEKRIPPQHNNSLAIDVWIRPESSGTTILDTTVTTDSEGRATICPISVDLITNQYYDVLVKGLSHLRRIFPHQKFQGSGAGFTLDLRSPVLFAGDSHPTADNYINSLDISYEILKIYSADLRADLNRDGIVNSLEFPTLISHLYAYGDH